MPQYSKEQLTGKSLEELRAIAAELDIKPNGLDERTLMYEILDQSAVRSATDKAISTKGATTRKRTRVKTVDRVYTANKEKAKKVEKTVKMNVDDSLFGALSDEEKDLMTKTQQTEEAQKPAPEQKETATAQASPESNKRARKSDGNKKVAPEAINEIAAAEEKPKKRGRKTNTEKSSREAEPAIPEQATTDDFIELEMTSTAVDDSNFVQDDAYHAQNKPTFVQETMQVDSYSEFVDEPANDTETAAFSRTFAPEQTEDTADFADLPAASTDQTLNLEFATKTATSSSADAEPTAAAHDAGNTFAADSNFFDSDGLDFIILEDIPTEAALLGYEPNGYPEPYMAATNHLQPTHASENNQYQRKAETIVPKQKEYHFGDLLTVTGVLETVDNYGFLRSSDYNYLSSPDDIYINQQQIKSYALKTGDVVEGTVNPPKEGEKFFTLGEIKRINGCTPNVIRDRVSFEFLTPLFPDQKFNLCRGDGGDSPSSRIVDLFSPIGKGQRALIVAQPKTGKTLLMKDIANSIARNHPEAYLIMLLIDERPEEVTDMARTVNAEVIASTFDASAENHVKIASIVLEKAKRMVECGHDVVIFLDSITRLARAYNTVSPASGKILSGGVDANALQKPKRFFGAARNIEGGGSLTIIATALIDTGSKMDEVIFEEFKGTGNMELQLDRSLSNKRIFPAVNLTASSTRRDDLLQDQATLNRMWILRKHIADMTPVEAMTFMQERIARTKSNEEFLSSMNG